MANNKSTIKTIPLDMKLNMNKNRTIVSPTFDMVNKNNSPVYGNTITNLHASTIGTGNSLWDRNGERYYVEDGKLKSTNKSWQELDLSDKYFFEKTKLNLDDIDGIAVQEVRVDDLPEDAKETTEYFYVAYKKSRGKVDLYLGDSEDTLEYATTIEPLEGRNITAVRLIPFNTDPNDKITPSVPSSLITYTAWNACGVYLIQEKTMLNEADDYKTNASFASFGFFDIVNKTFSYEFSHPLAMSGIPTGSNPYERVFTNIAADKTGSEAEETLQTNGNNWQIIVASIDFRDDLYSPSKQTYASTLGVTTEPYVSLGVTVLKKRYRGENLTTDFFYDNNLYSCVSWVNPLLTSIDPYVRAGWNVYAFDNSTFDENNVVTTRVTVSSNVVYFNLGVGYRKSSLLTTSASAQDVLTAYSDSNKNNLTITNETTNQTDNVLGIFVDDTNLVISVKPVSYDNSTNRKCVTSKVNNYGIGLSLYRVPTTAITDPTLCYRGTLIPATWEEAQTYEQDYEGAFYNHTDVYGIPNNIVGWALTTNQRYVRVLGYGRMTSSDQTGVNNTGSILYETTQPNTIFTSVGLQSTKTVPTTAGAWATWSTSAATDSSYVCYNSQGSSTQISNTNWRLLFNYKEGYISGISYGAKESLGKLVTEWDSIDDGFYVYADKDKVIYKNTKNNKVYKIERKAFSSISENEWIEKFNFVDERYIIGNVDVEYNAFDTVENTRENWANDWNNRVFAGVKYTIRDSKYMTEDWWDAIPADPIGGSSQKVSTVLAYRTWRTIVYDGVGKYTNSGSIASGVNVAYAATKSFAPSRLESYQSYTGILFGYETFLNAGSEQGVDLYTAKTASTPSYVYTVKVDNSGSTYAFSETGMEGLTYPVAPSGTAYSNVPIVGVEYIESYNGKFAVKIDDTVYGIVYNGIRPVGLYNTASLTDDVDEFFIVQGQYYAVVNGYIAAVYYSSTGTLSSIEQIIDVNGMTFIGAFPSVAYFWAPATQSIYAFTGDADLQLFVQSNKITEVNNHLYDPSSEWILLSTNDGLYVLTQINVFKSDQLQDVHSFWSTDDGFIVVIWDSDYKNTKLSLRKLDDTYVTLPIELETAFFGLGNMQESVLDTWYLRFYRNDEDYNGKIVVKTKTLTDKVYNGKKTKTEVVTKDKWDENDNFYIRFSPEEQKSQGMSLSIKSDYPIAYIGCSITPDNVQLSKYNF